MEATLLHHRDISPEQWDAFIHASPQGMIYHRYHYISAVAPDWQAIIVKAGEHIQAVFPMEVRRKYGIQYALQPVFAQYWGICFRPIDSKISKEYETKKTLVNEVIKAIPAKLRLFEYQFSPAFDYPAPFIWSGYTVKPRFTLQINIRPSLDDIWSHFGDGARRDIKKAEKAGIAIEELPAVEPVIALFRESRGEKVKSVKDQEYERLAKVFHSHARKGESFVLGAKTQEGELIAGILFFQFRDTTIYYFGGTADAYRNSGAMSLIIWAAIRRVHGASSIFDFDGSMIESIEKFFRSFGAVPVPYYSIRKARFPFKN